MRMRPFWVVGIVAGGALLVPPPALGAGLLAHWKMDDAAADNVVIDSAGDNHGALQDMWGALNTADCSVEGKFGTAIDFYSSEIEAWADLSTHVDALTPAGDFTLATWLLGYPVDIENNQTLFAWCNGDTAVTPRIQFDVGKARGVGNGVSYGWTIDPPDYFDTCASPSLTWDPEAWHHVAVVYTEADDTVRLYQDGVEQSSATQGHIGTAIQRPDGNPEGYTYSQAFIGKVDYNVGEQYAMLALDDMAIWDVALSESQLAAVVTQGAEFWDTAVAQDGDLDGDGFVGSADLDIVRANWGASVTPGDLASGDPSRDGLVGSADLDIVRANWGEGAPAAVPEPLVAVPVLSLAALAAIRRRTN